MDLIYYIAIDTTKISTTDIARKDYRFGKLYLYEKITSSTLKNRDKMSEPLKAKYLGDGVVKLFVKSEDVNQANNNNSSIQPAKENKYMMAILSVPSYFTYNDLLDFIGDRYTDEKTVIQIIKSTDLNKFTVIVDFHDNETLSLQFQEEFNGRQFNSMDQETCSVIKIDRLIISSPKNTPIEKSSDSSSRNQEESSLHTEISSNDFSSSILAKLSQEAKELPTCTVCLERMDSSVSGLIIIPCQHNFHCQCLSKWADDTCPVCRYSSATVFNKSFSSSASHESNDIFPNQSNSDNSEICGECDAAENLWICLICGHIGCSRYDGGHALQHFKDNGHCFSMGMESQRIWDYVGDIYVHRLIANSDGKLMELPDNDRNRKSAQSDELSCYENNSNADNGDKNRKFSNYSENISNSRLSSSSSDKFIATKQSSGGRAYIEYSNILRSQLESQREYFETKLSDCQGKYENKLSDITETINKYKIQNDQLKRTDEELIKYKKMYNEEKIMVNNLMRRIDQLNKLTSGFKNKIQELATEVSDLNDQNKDLMFYLETQQKFEDMPDDAKEGQVVISYPNTNTNKKKKKKKASEKSTT